MIMNGNTTKASATKPAIKLSSSESGNLHTSYQETFEPATMDELLQEWGAYMRLRAKIRQLFVQETGHRSADKNACCADGE
jgi:hypothetical protein